MSRLESMMRRLSAQKIGLEWAIEATKDIAGDALEIGLGNGRSYDHLREKVTNRRVWVIDRQLQCHPSCVPPKEDFLQGEAEDMFAEMKKRGMQISLAHYDFGIGVTERDEAEAARLSPMIKAVMAPDAIILSCQPLIGFTHIKGPEGIPAGRYHFYRNEA